MSSPSDRFVGEDLHRGEVTDGDVVHARNGGKDDLTTRENVDRIDLALAALPLDEESTADVPGFDDGSDDHLPSQCAFHTASTLSMGSGRNTNTVVYHNYLFLSIVK